MEIEVKPGYKAGTKITFAGEGDELGSTGKAQDVVFIIGEKKRKMKPILCMAIALLTAATATLTQVNASLWAARLADEKGTLSARQRAHLS